MNKDWYNNVITGYQKIIKWLDNASNQSSKFKRNNWTEINDQSRGVYNTNTEIRIKDTMLKSSLSNYSDTYILIKGTIKITGAKDKAGARQADEEIEE